MAPVKELLLLRSVVETFAEKSHDFPTQYALTFINVAMNEGCSNSDLMEYTGLSTAAVARNVQALSPYRDRNKKLPGYNLVYSEVDPDDNRRRRIYLTKDGHQLVADLVRKVGGDETAAKEIEKSGRKAISRETIPPTYFAPAHKVYEKNETQE